MTIFSITKDHIKALNDEQARELIARLARAEVVSTGGASSGVFWGGNQRAADEGVDVEVVSAGVRRHFDFVPRDHVIFQVKAEVFPPAKIGGEMKPRGELRASLIELGNAGGAYIIASTKDDCALPAISGRHKAMEESLTELEEDKRPRIFFYDSRKLADWTECHPSVALWVKTQLGINTSGWQPYGPWAHLETDVDSSFIIDEKSKIYEPSGDDAISTELAVEYLRRDLSSSGSIRLIGLSGVGKTRLAQVLFDDRLATRTSALPKDNVIYCDLSDKPEPAPEQLIDMLDAQGSDAVLIIDNCGPEPHARLTRKITKENCELKLLTIEYDIRDDVPERTRCYRMEGASLEMLRNLLRREFTNLSYENILKIAEFSDGNARIAFALAGAVDAGEELQRLRNSDLFDRLFKQSHEHSDTLLEAAKAFSLLYSFDGEDTAENGELSILANEAGLSVRDSLRAVSELQKRGLVQSRGKWRAVLPHAIANELATRMLADCPADYWLQQFIPKCSTRMRKSFIRRIGYLHDLSGAQKIASALLALEPFSRPELHTSDLREEFRSLATVCPADALRILEIAAESAELVACSNQRRSHYIDLLSQIAYWPEHFDKCAHLLVRFAIVEPEHHNDRPASRALEQLFTIVLSGTLAGARQRLVVVRTLLNDPETSQLGCELVRAALKSNHFASFRSGDFGAHKRTSGWRPENPDQTKEWYQTWFKILSDFGHSSRTTSDEIRNGFAENLRSLWHIKELRGDVAKLCRFFHADKPFIDGWLGFKRSLYYDYRKGETDGRSDIEELEKDLRPTSLRDQVLARVTSSRIVTLHELEDDASYDADDESTLREKRKSALLRTRNLGRVAGQDVELIQSLLPELCGGGSGGGSFELGRGIGEAEGSSDQIIQSLYAYMASNDDQYVSLNWFRGFLASVAHRDRPAFEQFMDRAQHDPIWLRYFVEMQQVVDLDDRAFERLMNVLNRPECSSHQFRCLAWGGNTKSLSAEQLLKLLNALAARDGIGLTEAIEILQMAQFGSNERSADEKIALEKMSFEFLSDLDWSQLADRQNDDGYQIKEVVSFSLQGSLSADAAAALLQRIIPPDENGYGDYNETRKAAMRPFFKKYPRVALDNVCKPDDSNSYDELFYLLSNRFQDEGSSMIGLVPDNVLIEWCCEDRDKRIPFALEHLPLFEKSNDESDAPQIRSAIIPLWQSAEDKREALKSLTDRMVPMSWSGSRADIIEKRAKLLDQLTENGEPATKEILEESRRALNEIIAKERDSERIDQRRELESFE